MSQPRFRRLRIYVAFYLLVLVILGVAVPIVLHFDKSAVNRFGGLFVAWVSQWSLNAALFTASTAFFWLHLPANLCQFDKVWHNEKRKPTGTSLFFQGTAYAMSLCRLDLGFALVYLNSRHGFGWYCVLCAIPGFFVFMPNVIQTWRARPPKWLLAAVSVCSLLLLIYMFKRGMKGDPMLYSFGLYFMDNGLRFVSILSLVLFGMNAIIGPPHAFLRIRRLGDEVFDPWASIFMVPSYCFGAVLTLRTQPPLWGWWIGIMCCAISFRSLLLLYYWWKKFFGSGILCYRGIDLSGLIDKRSSSREDDECRRVRS